MKTKTRAPVRTKKVHPCEDAGSFGPSIFIYIYEKCNFLYIFLSFTSLYTLSYKIQATGTPPAARDGLPGVF
ncbi:MAG TPA: hypothetical protein VNQ97_02730, partial [Burkholderiaceae bacterium]|nr:hypothetical protein [Burkholderiaceae bacterium]